MKKISTLYVIIAIVLLACQSPSPTDYQNSPAFKKTKDSLMAVMDSMQKAQSIDSAKRAIANGIENKIYFDTVGLYMAPVKVLSSKIVSSESGVYRNIRVSYKNTTKKAINGIRFKWYGVNAFGEPADMGSSYDNGLGAGYTDNGIAAGDEDNSTFEILSSNAKKVILTWAYEVVFEDGTKWELGK